MLRTERKGTISAISSLTDTLANLSKEIGMQHFAPLQCYYRHGRPHGHVCLLTQETTANCVRVQIRAESGRKMQWFIRRLKSVLPDSCRLDAASKDDDNIETCPLRHLPSAVKLLSDAEKVKPTEDEPMIIEETSAETPLDKIRKAFVKKQSKVLALRQERTGGLKIAPEKYQTFQTEFFQLYL